MSLNDIFGHMPGRPEHPDMNTLSDIVLQMDGKSYDADFVYEDFLGERADPDSLVYFAKQRALRMLTQLGKDPNQNSKLMAAMASMWLDAFVVGHAFQERRRTD